MSSSDQPPRPNLRHSLRDHLLGAGAGHAHDDDADHDHDHDDQGHHLLDINARSLESIPLVSMGIDVGSSGTQIAFSRLLMRGPGEPLAMRRHAASRSTLYMSPVSLTPFRNAHEIDEVRLRAIIDRAFEAAGVTPDDVETGVVILTGEAMARDNARAITQMLAEDLGELVCASAGHHMEAMLAAYGSGAVRRSLEQGATLVDIDIGGGTTKLARIVDGRILASGALAIGGRQLAWSREDVITRCDASAGALLRRAGLDWSVGDKINRADLDRLADAMAEALLSAMLEPAGAGDLWLTEPIAVLPADGLIFSGGVAEYVYERETRDFGDMGRRLGRAIRVRLAAGAMPAPLLPAGECIRATALGASEFSVQMSGQTSFISHPSLVLPRRNLPVLQPTVSLLGMPDASAIASAVHAHRAAFDLADGAREFALAFRWRGEHDYARVRALADGIYDGLADRIAAGAPIYIMLEGDAGLTLGAILRDEKHVESPCLVLDGLVLRDFDFVDVGRIRLPSGMVPVTIKSLLFDVTRSANATP
ncbi:MAG: Reactivating factor of Adenosylcobalamin-dependent ethanolamine ammonia lyase [Hyphomicrobiales bacterium]|nr:Reactivating factor of Adenosylcobalamin-dependent ethanolamine ammonia lyase [Hyphomicrobiales bacterium]